MQEALKNPHFKKIWEEINWKARHPKAKSLEEALEMEKEKDDCGLLLKDSIFTHNNMVGIKSANIALKTANLSYAKRKDIMGAEFKILGRPISLFNVLHLLNKQHWLYVADGTKIYFVDKNAKGTKIFCDFTSNLLEEQTPETWEKIANVI